jgi:UDP-2,3-diacylglucosamine hydrolase
MHKLEIDGVPAKRIVLGDWYELDSVLIYDETGFRFERVANYINNS